MQIEALLDSNAFVGFIDKELIQQHHNLTLVENATLVVVEVINGQNLSLGPVTHETKVLMVTIGSHSSKLFSMSSYL
jgi:hypothetical protein